MGILTALMGGADMPNRTLCDTLQEMRELIGHLTEIYEPVVPAEQPDAALLYHKSFNALKHTILGLLEEAQTCGNRMESALYDTHEVLHGIKTKQKLKAARRKLLHEIIDIELDIEQLREEKKKKLAKGLTKKKKTGTIKSKKKGGE